MHRTKIVCTIGPGSLSESMLLELQQAGMNIARLNGSHANLDWHHNAIQKIHRVLPETAILLDIPGRKIRTGILAREPTFSVGDMVVLTSDAAYYGIEKVPVNYSDLHVDLSVGDIVMADDGTLRFTVVKIDGSDVQCRAEVAGQLKSRKGINVPFVTLNTPQVTSRDAQMIDFACENQVDFVGLSFVESADHISTIRRLIRNRGPRIVAKVENRGGIDNIHEIAKTADAIMIDRGDLSVETSLYDVAMKQKEIINAARAHGTPVIVATEMLHSMIQNSFPTKAEVTDISNAVLDGCSATMLSGETAIGRFAVDSVNTMRQVIESAELYQTRSNFNAQNYELRKTPKAISEVIPLLCASLPITVIVAITRSGYAARMIATHGLPQPILAVSDDQAAARSFNLIAGTQGIFSEVRFSKRNTDHVAHILRLLLSRKYLSPQDVALVTSVSYPASGNRMNTIQIFSMKDLISAFGWSDLLEPPLEHATEPA